LPTWKKVLPENRKVKKVRVEPRFFLKLQRIKRKKKNKKTTEMSKKRNEWGESAEKKMRRKAETEVPLKKDRSRKGGGK